MNRQSNDLPSSSQETVIKAAGGDASALTQILIDHMSMVTSIARAYSGKGPELEDLMQEGMIALLDAVNGYKTGGDAVFSTYAFRCVTNRMLTVLRKHHRVKNKPLNSYTPLDELDEKSIVDTESDPQALLIASEESSTRAIKISTLLSEFERNVLELYLGACSYEDIAKKMNISSKAVDNALQRVRRKLQSSHGEQL